MNTLTDGAFLTTTEYLEGVAAIQVNGNRTPYLGFYTLTASEYVECLTKHIHTLLGKDYATATLQDMILVVAIELILTSLVLLHSVEESAAVNDRVVDIDYHVTVDDTAGVAAAIDITTIETTVEVFSGTGAWVA